MKAETAALVTRWQSFLGKVRGRLEAILAEADAGFDQLIAMNVSDPAPLAGAVSAFDARLRGLATKVEEAWEQLDEQLTSSSQLKRRDELHRQGRQLEREIMVRGEELSIRKRAAAARGQWQLAEQEMAQPQRCVNCGGDLVLAQRHATQNATCGSCGAVNTVRAGQATTYLFYANGLHALAEEAALEPWRALKAEEARDEELRGSTAADEQRLEAAHHAYWRAYCEAMGRMHPDWTPEQVERELRAKMSSFRYSL